MKQVKWGVGQLVQHRLFGYRGVIYDVDSEFMLTDEWYEIVAKSRPPKHEPWYRVLVDGATNETYVAQRNLEADGEDKPIVHPAISQYFSGFEDGHYIVGRKH